MNSLIVSKFGGTSMGSAEAMKKAADLVACRDEVRVVVVSATSGTTNQLLKIHRLDDLKKIAEELCLLENRHLDIAKELKCSESQVQALQEIFQELQKCLETKSVAEEILDQLLATGERLSSILFTQALIQAGKNAITMDARKLLRTDSFFGRAEPDPKETAALCSSWKNRILESKDVFVTQGFIGSDAQGRTTTLGRGGSDYSAALFAEALAAREVEIWTDVPGILTMDPNVVSSARIIPEISFSEAAEMANFGAKVLHPATLWPAVRANVPVFVGSTFAPTNGGTRILPDQKSSAPLIRAIAVRKRQTLITVSSLRMLNAQGFLAKMFQVLANHHLSVDLVTTSEVSVALTIDEGSLGSGGKSVLENKELLTELRSFAEVKVEEDLALVAIIGNSLTHTSGVAAKAFPSIQEFNLRLICHGASEHNVCFLVSSKEATEVAKRLHHVCIEWKSI